MNDNILSLLNSPNLEDNILGVRIFVESSTQEEVINTFKIYPQYAKQVHIPDYCFINRGCKKSTILQFKDICVLMGRRTISAVYNYQVENLDINEDCWNKIDFYE